MKIERQDVYVCSKPLQFFYIKNIECKDVVSSKKVLIVIDSFYEANSFASQIRKYDTTWDSVLLLKDEKHLYLWLLKNIVSNCYLSCDLSWCVYFLCLLKRIGSLYAYEEGIGSYSNVNEYEMANTKRSHITRAIRKFIGMGLFFGDSLFCKGIYLTKPNLYNIKLKSKKGLPFCDSFLNCLHSNEDLFVKVSGLMPHILNVRNKSVLIYATEWTISDAILGKYLREYRNYDLNIIKLHPHIIKNELTLDTGINILQTRVTMELILSYLLKRNNRVTVWHQNSTSVVHFLDSIESVPFPINPECERVYNEYVNG